MPNKIKKSNDIKINDCSALVNVFKYCMNVLRDNEGLTGEKALRTLSYLLTLKLLEPQFNGNIDIDNYEFDFSHIIDENVEKHKKKLLEIIRFSNIVKEKDVNLHFNMKFLWDDILSVHPSTKNIFTKDKCFEIKHVTTYKKIIDKLNTFNMSDYDIDVLGNAYEEVIKDVMTGKVLGQYFTQPSVKKMMVKLIDPQIHNDGTIESCCDPTMGTGGFLITYLLDIMKKAKNKKIELDWSNILNDGIYGKEIDPDTYQLAVSNMLISTGHMFHKLDRCDSIRKPITRKFDNILANPPFGIKGLKYDDIQNELKNEYIPIKTDNAVSLFIQAIIYMLKINGKCAIVLPDGQDLFSKTNKALISIREYLMKTCDLKEVIHMPAGVFTYTSIKTCIFYFTKKKEGADILKTVTNASKTNSKNYKFVKEHQTTHVKFYDYDPYKDTKKLLIEVSIKNISNNTYSLNYVEYIENNKNSKNEEYDNGIAMKKLSDVCDIDYGTRIVKSKNVEGEYPVYGSGRAMFSTNSFNREGFNILIGRFALSPSCVRLINEKIFLNDSGLTVKPKTKKVIHKYIGYYLLHNQQKIYDCARGTAQKNLDMETFKDLKVPIPSLKQQKEIVEHCERIDEIIKKLENDIEHNKQQTQQYVDNIIKLKNVKQSHNVDDDSNSNGNSDSDGDSHSDSDSDSDDNIDDDIVDDDIVDDNVKVQSKKSTKNIGNGNGNGKGKGKESSNDEPKTVKIVKKTKKPIIKKK